MKKKTLQPKAEKAITESFFIKYMQDLKAFMLQTFATKIEFKRLENDVDGIKVEIRDFKNDVNRRFDKIDNKLEEIDATLTVHVTDIHDHEDRLKALEHRKN